MHLIATRATTMQKIQKTDEFTDAVQGEGCGCAKCDATTVTADVERSMVQFLNRVDDVPVVLTMNAQGEASRKLGSEQRGALSNKVSTEGVETFSAMVKLVQEIDESARESEYCGFHEKRVLTRNGGDVEKDAVALDEEKGEIILEELRNLHQFTDSIDNFVMHAAPSEKDNTSRALKWPDDDPTQSSLRRCSP